MASSRLRKALSKLKRRRKASPVAHQLADKRQLQLESLEDRRMMAQGPSLVTVIPNDELALTGGPTSTLTFAAPFPTSPREITFRFAQGNWIDSATLASGIKVVRAGGDGIFDQPGAPAPNDVSVLPGFLGLGDSPREVGMRFASNLPDDVYRITLVGTGLTPLKDTSGNPFTVAGVPADQTVNFTLDQG